jgi:hypothetical protein
MTKMALEERQITGFGPGFNSVVPEANFLEISDFEKKIELSGIRLPLDVERQRDPGVQVFPAKNLAVFRESLTSGMTDEG